MRGSRSRWAASPCPRRRTRRRGIGTLSRNLGVQWRRGRRAKREGRISVRGRPRARRTRRQRKRVPLQSGSYCTMQCGLYNPRSRLISALIAAETVRNVPWVLAGFYPQPSPCVIVSSQRCTSIASRRA